MLHSFLVYTLEDKNSIVFSNHKESKCFFYPIYSISMLYYNNESINIRSEFTKIQDVEQLKHFMVVMDKHWNQQ